MARVEYFALPGTKRPDLRFGLGLQADPLMPSARYYERQANTLLSWSKATKDKAYAVRLRTQAIKELEEATQAREAVADLNALLCEFNTQQLLKGT
jgi:hypothetical protein